jgi:LysR substrate binding domain
VLRELREAERAVAALARPERAALTLGAERGVGEAALCELLERIGAAGDGAPAVSGVAVADALGAVEAGALDGALVELPCRPGRFCAAVVRREPYVLAVPGHWRLAARGRLRCAGELAGTRLVVQPRCPGDTRLREQLRAGRVPFVVAGTAGGRAAAQALAEGAHAAVLLPRAEAAGLAARGWRLVDASGVAADRVLGFAWPEGRAGDAALAAVRAAVLALAEAPRTLAA